MVQHPVVALVEVMCVDLSDLELAVLNNVAQLDGNPHNRVFDYEKVSALFTERDGTRMHDETKDALAVVVNNRLA